MKRKYMKLKRKADDRHAGPLKHLWMQVMFELLGFFMHRVNHDLRVFDAYNPVGDSTWGVQPSGGFYYRDPSGHSHWGNYIDLLVLNRERRKSVRFAKRNPNPKMMCDINIRLLCITPGVGSHLLSFLNPKWLAGCVFDQDNWYMRPKVHVLPPMFNLCQRAFNIRHSLTAFCTNHVLPPKPTSQYYLSREKCLPLEFAALGEPTPFYARQIEEYKSIINWHCTGSGWTEQWVQNVNFEEYKRIHDPSIQEHQWKHHPSACNWKWDRRVVQMPDRTMGNQHWMKNKRWEAQGDDAVWKRVPGGWKNYAFLKCTKLPEAEDNWYAPGGGFYGWHVYDNI
jgi:hypothetical protein